MLKKKIQKIVIGSNNKGKIKEIRDLIPKKYKIFTPRQFKLKSPVENGKSFKENSLIKAKNFSLKFVPYLFVAVTILTAFGSNSGTWA